jgi:hypothetical protein
MALLGHYSKFLALTLAGLLASVVISYAEPPAPLNENEIKAAAFYNVLAFTNWPSEAFSSPDAPLVVAIIGHGPTSDLLDKIVNGETWRNRRIVVEHHDTAGALGPCQVVYIARSAQANWPKIRTLCANRPVLTVSDAPNFANSGGNVQLAIEQSRLRIFVNLATTRSNGLQLSSNLLHLAKIIGPIPDPRTPQSGLQLSPLDGLTLCLAQTR